MARATRLIRTVGFFLILAPAAAHAQFETLRFVDLPAVGSWAEYEVSAGVSGDVKIIKQRVSVVARHRLGQDEFFWFQLQTQSDDYGPRRVPVVYQLALRGDDAASGEDLFKHVRELIVQIDTAPAVRIPYDYLELGASQNILTGGARGAGTNVDFAFRDLDPETVQTVAGELHCEHKKGLGRASVSLNFDDPARFEVDAIRDVWFSNDVPFGLVRQVSQQSGTGPQTDGVAMSLETEQRIELIAYGAGAQSAIKGQVFEYQPALASEFRPAGGESAATP